MLHIIRKVGEKIFIDKGRIQVMVMSNAEGLMTLGIKAPLDIDIARGEVFCPKTAGEKLEALQKAVRHKIYRETQA